MLAEVEALQIMETRLEERRALVVLVAAALEVKVMP
jgi:hypothetical protein